MKKESIIGFVVWMLLFVAAAIVGFIFLREYNTHSGLQQGEFILFFAGAIVGGLLFNAILFELAHIVGAVLGGYKILSVTILGLCFYSKEGKFRIGFSKYDGLSGETKILPKQRKKNKKNNPVLYSVMGTIFFGIEFLAVLFVFVMFQDAWSLEPARKDLSNIAWFFMVFMVIGLIILVYNILPFRLDSMTDGYKLVLLSKQANIDAYNELLRVEDLGRNGKEITEMKVFEEITEFTANINLFSVYNHLNNGEYEEADKILDLMVADPKKLEPSTYNRIVAQKVFIAIMTKNEDGAREVYDKLADDKIRRYIANDVSIESVRAYLLISGLIDKSRGEVNYAINRKTKALKRCLKQRIEIESKLYDLALNKVYEAHPNWKEQKENAAE